jgi:nonribosomal peptide synthetase protein BlmVII
VKVALLLAELRSRDIQLWADGDALQCNAPAGALTPELRAQLLQRRSEILEFLRGPGELSFSQERLWVLDQIEPGGAAYVIALALEMRGALDVTALERALATLVRRHESLRTVFAELDGRPLQVVSEPAAWALPVAQVSGEADARERLREEVSRGFDLARGPLFRAHLYRLAADAHVLQAVKWKW